MRQAIVTGVSALLLAVLLPGWLLPEKAERVQEPLVLIIEEPQRNRVQQSVTIRRGDQLQQMPLEDYLVGVVLSEMPASFEPEALKAQAVAARTFALRQMESGKHTDCDLCSNSSCCQAWNSREALEEKLGQSGAHWWEKAEQAVRDTEGEVLTYDGQLIDAVYFSCSGGQTEDAVAVWGSDVPYLQSVISEGEEQASVFQSVTSVSREAFRDCILEEYPEAKLQGDAETWFGEIIHTEGGGVESARIGGLVIPGTKLRQLFHLNSTRFEIRMENGQIVFSVKGYGHRVGMSQYGANAMAASGSTYRDILMHYYTGAEVEPAQ